MKTVFALIDCDNFFVSCERLFRPDLEGRPVVVLSSNDGCAVSRSNEAKALGIPMGAPLFKYRQLFKEQGVVVFSAHFELYGDISERITRVLTNITPRTEVYSVDEAFLDLSELTINSYNAWGKQTRQRILRDVGIPVSIGVATSKTLAKLAREHAKKDPALDGVLSLIDTHSTTIEHYLKSTSVSDVWGVGWRLAPKLRAEGIYNAWALSSMQPRHAQQLMSIKGRQTVAELNGQSCMPLEPMDRTRQSIMCGRMFGHDTDNPDAIQAALASLTARATRTLRREGLLAHKAVIRINTNKHKPGYIIQQAELELSTPTADTGLLASKLSTLAQTMIKPGRAYHRANIYLYDLVDSSRWQPDLMGKANVREADSSSRRMDAVDSLNKQYGKTTVRYAAEDLSKEWLPKRGQRSPNYTTDWDELPKIK